MIVRKLIILIQVLLIVSCATQKPIIKDVPDIDKNSSIYFSKNDFSLTFNGDVVYNLITFGSTNTKSENGEKVINAESETNILNYPFGKFDYSFALEPSLSITSKYLLRATEEFSLFKISFSREIDIEILDLLNIENIYKYSITLPSMEFSDEKYQVPWSSIDESFFAIQNDSLYKIYPNLKKKLLLLTIPKLYNFCVSKSEKSALILANDTLWHFDLLAAQKKEVYSVGRKFGNNLKYVKSFSWNEDDSKVTFSIDWDFFIYNLSDGRLDKIETDAKIFSIEWLGNDQLILVSGDYPSDLSTLQSRKSFSIITYTISSNKFKTIHERLNHEPFSIKPKVSPSRKYILFSEKKLNGPYQVKLMTLDGQNENILAEGYLPFWGK